MKRFAIVILFFFSFILYSNAQADDICGYWLTLKGNTQIQIIKAANNMYYGKIVWLRAHKDRPDYRNPIEKFRTRKVLGLQIMNNFIFNPESNYYEKGTIYDPEIGYTYIVRLWFDENKNILKLKGHVVGMKFLSRESTWIRENNLRQ